MKTLHFTRGKIWSVICLWIMICTGFTAIAQKKTEPKAKTNNQVNRYKVGLLVKAFGDSVVVRWAPDKPELFREALRGGYLLTRRSIQEDNSQTVDFQVLVKPWNVDTWLKNTSKNDTLAAACAQLVNGKNTPLKSDEAITLDKIMQQQNQSDMRMTMAIILADIKPIYAMGMALGFIDKNVKTGKRYTYFLKPLVNPYRFSVEVAATYILNDKETDAEQMVPIHVTSGEHSVQLAWERALAETKFSSYFFERSENGGKTFKRVNQIPWLQPMENALTQTIIYTDSVKENYKNYQYRVLGITPFGELISSETVTGQGIDKTPPPPAMRMQAKYLGKGNVKIKWDYDKAPADLAGFVIGKSNSMDGVFVPVHSQPLAPGQREAIDSTVSGSCYYKIVALDTAKNLGSGLPVYCIVNDHKGPSKPKNLQGYIDSTGVIKIIWDANPEPNIYGYKVLSANATDHVFIPKSNGFLAIPGFIDTTTVYTLTRKKYYRVVAYDNNYNPSEPSEILALTRPDMVPPIAPVISSYTVTDSAIAVKWSLSPSADVKEQHLMRRGKRTERWKLLATLGPGQNEYFDKTMKGESDYGYALMTIDSAGLKSDLSFPLNVTTPRLTPAVVQGLRAFLNPDKSVSLYWDYTIPNCKYAIYKSLDKGNLYSYDSVYDNREFRDKRPEKGFTKYAVKVIYQDGRQSKLSSTIDVNVK